MKLFRKTVALTRRTSPNSPEVSWRSFRNLRDTFFGTRRSVPRNGWIFGTGAQFVRIDRAIIPEAITGSTDQSSLTDDFGRLAGAGVKRATSFGATDEFGHKAIENVVTVHDLHATILHLLGLDHERLSYYHNGIERRLTDVHGRVIHEILA